MNICVRSIVALTLLGSFAAQSAAGADLAALDKWTGKQPYDKIVGGKSLWDQPGAAAAMRAAMGAELFARSRKIMHGPETPVAADGKGKLAAWSCKAHDCGDNQMSVFFDLPAGTAQVCWRAADRSGKVADLWLADGKQRPLPKDGCLTQESDPFGPLKKFGSGV